jgi:TPR repeat protein
MYDTREGVPENDQEAVKLHRKAAGQGNAEAQLMLGLNCQSGTGAQINDSWKRGVVVG